MLNDPESGAGVPDSRDYRRDSQRTDRYVWGLHGLRDENALESAIAAGQNVYYYGGGDIYEVAAAYGFHLAESQAYFDGNKRTGAQAVVVFLEGCGVDTSSLSEDATYDLIIQFATHKATRADFAAFLRSELAAT